MANDTNQFGLWQPWQPKEVARFFSTLTVPWWIAGGWALDLFLGEQTRDHEDIDVQILRRDQQESSHGFSVSGMSKERTLESFQLSGLSVSGNRARSSVRVSMMSGAVQTRPIPGLSNSWLPIPLMTSGSSGAMHVFVARCDCGAPNERWYPVSRSRNSALVQGQSATPQRRGGLRQDTPSS